MTGWAKGLRGGLPAESSSFIGRTAELAELSSALIPGRLVTVSGVGGVGKTRLALRAAAAARGRYPDGAWLAQLSTQRDPDLLPHMIAAALPLYDQTSSPMDEVVVEFLRSRQILLILDTCDRVTAAAGRFADELLQAAPQLTILATSRQPLRSTREHLLPLAPLPVGVRAGPGEAVQLFADRAAAVAPGFRIKPENESVVAMICRRVDGIPLAIELAAARIGELTIEEIDTALDDRFRLLRGGSYAVPARHRTMLAAIEWSHDLCDSAERLLWARLSAFPADFDAVAAAAVCADPGAAATSVASSAGDEELPAAVFDEVLTRLIDKSIVVVADGRYRLLDTVQEFGAARLSGPAERDRLRRRHRDWYLKLAEEFDADWFGPRQVEWAARMRAERVNLHAALSYCVDHEAESALRLASALTYYWYSSDALQEGRYWIDQALRADAPHGMPRLKALISLSGLTRIQGDHQGAVDLGRAAIQLADQLGEPVMRARAGVELATVLTLLGEYATSRRLLDEALVEFDADDMFVAIATGNLAHVDLMEGDVARAAELSAECRAFCTARGEFWWRGYACMLAAMAASAVGDVPLAIESVREGLRVRDLLDDPVGTAGCLERLGWLAAEECDFPRAARLLGAASQYWKRIGRMLYGAAQLIRNHADYERRVRVALGDAEFEREFHAGAGQARDDIIGYALG